MADEEFSYDGSEGADEYHYDDSVVDTDRADHADNRAEDTEPVAAPTIVDKLKQLTTQQKVILFVVVVFVVYGGMSVLSPSKSLPPPTAAKTSVARPSAPVSTPATAPVAATNSQATGVAPVGPLPVKDPVPQAVPQGDAQVASLQQTNDQMSQQLFDSLMKGAVNPAPTTSNQMASKGAVVPAAPAQQKSSAQMAPARVSADHSAGVSSKEMEDIKSSIIAIANAQQQDRAQVLNQFSAIKQSQDRLINQLNRISGELADLNTRVKSVEGQKVVSRTSMVQASASQQTKKAPMPKAKAIPLFVEAVVPGRAWLQTKDGRTVTVTVGESIKGYGMVTMIDPYTGDVKTSSGSVIRYGVGAN